MSKGLFNRFLVVPALLIYSGFSASAQTSQTTAPVAVPGSATTTLGQNGITTLGETFQFSDRSRTIIAIDVAFDSSGNPYTPNPIRTAAAPTAVSNNVTPGNYFGSAANDAGNSQIVVNPSKINQLFSAGSMLAVTSGTNPDSVNWYTTPAGGDFTKNPIYSTVIKAQIDPATAAAIGSWGTTSDGQLVSVCWTDAATDATGATIPASITFTPYTNNAYGVSTNVNTPGKPIVFRQKVAASPGPNGTGSP